MVVVVVIMNTAKDSKKYIKENTKKHLYAAIPNEEEKANSTYLCKLK